MKSLKKIVGIIHQKVEKKIESYIISGKFGSGIRFDYYMGSKKMSPRHIPEVWREELLQFSQKYNEIRMYVFADVTYNRIGEFVARFPRMIEEKEIHENQGILDVLLFNDTRNIDYNARAVEVLKRAYVIIMHDDYLKWRFIIRSFRNVNWEHLNKYRDRNDDKKIRSFEETRSIIALTNEEEKEGKEKARIMGIRGTFVCISNRDSAYLKKTTDRPEGFYAYHNNRDSNIETRRKAVTYLYKQGIQSVRMGRVIKKPFICNGCIQYAEKYYDELMDLYLSKYCKFFVSDPSGINTLSVLYGTPQVFVNDVTSLGVGGYYGMPNREDNIMIFKKIWSEQKKRYLNLKEMVEIQYLCGSNAIKNTEYAVKFLNNTEEEILDVVKEMNDRLDGTWVETEEDQLLQFKAKSIITEWCALRGFSDDGNWYRGRFGAQFLRDNKEIFELS